MASAKRLMRLIKFLLIYTSGSCARTGCSAWDWGDDEEATRTAALWGPDPVHPTSVAYRMIAEAIEADLQDLDASYTNPPPKKIQTGAKKARHDPNQERAGWVDGCSAALPRRDSVTGPRQRGRSISALPATPGPPPCRYNRGRGSARGFQQGYSRSGSRGYPLRGWRGSY
jgi:hypothetical protein